FGALGACVGSFLNVVVLRFGFGERPNARSECAGCGTQLHASDLVPIFSYLFLGGRCRSCGSGLNPQYPLIEFCTALLFALTYLGLLPASLFEIGEFLALLGFWSAFMALVAYDIRHTLIPLPFIYALFGFAGLMAGVRALADVSLEPLGYALLGALVCGGFFALIHVVTNGKGMGIGDAYVAAAIGAAFGVGQGVAASILGVWIGALVGVVALLIGRLFPHAAVTLYGRRVTLSTEIPFAPFLMIGAVVATLCHVDFLSSNFLLLSGFL
ncbi:MAG: prepilin peptidase, partial [Patescibacteria group bacterium]